MCRSEGSLSQEIRKKIALFASLPPSAIVSACDVDNIYKVPLTFREQGVDDFILDHFALEAPAPDLSSWQEPIERAEQASRTVRIALVGKYVQLEDAYLSVSEALRHAAALRDARVRDRLGGLRTAGGRRGARRAERERAAAVLAAADGILIPGGFGGRGIEGKIAAARVAREQGIPYLGICLGMQVAVAEFARHVAGMEGANSTEFDLETPYPVIDLLPEQKEVADLGGHDAPGRRPDQAPRGLPRAGDLRGGRGLRASPPPLRGQQPAAQAAHRPRRPARRAGSA